MAKTTRQYNRTASRTPVYGNVAYAPVYGGSAAPKYDEDVFRKKQRQPQAAPEIRTRKREQVKTRTRVAVRPQQAVAPFAIAGFVLAAVMAVLVLVSYIQLNAIYTETVSLQHQLTQLQIEGEGLEAQYEKVFSTEILTHAADKAGNLTVPAESQKVYLDLSEENNAVVYNPDESATGVGGFVREVKEVVEGIQAYFHA